MRMGLIIIPIRNSIVSEIDGQLQLKRLYMQILIDHTDLVVPQNC